MNTKDKKKSIIQAGYKAVDELIDLEELNEEKAAQLIMTARAPWFE